MKIINKIWKYFEGKKRNIGIIAGFILKGLVLTKPDLIPTDVVNYINTGIDIFLLGGMFDSVRRTDSGKKIINSTINAATNTVNKTKNLINNNKN